MRSDSVGIRPPVFQSGGNEGAVLPFEAAALLHEMTTDSRHRYLDRLTPPSAPAVQVMLERMVGHKQVTDGYLVALAHAHDAIFVTFDSRLGPQRERHPRIEFLGA